MRGRCLRGWALLFAILSIAAVARAAQDPQDFYGRTVTSVRFEVEGRPETSLSLASLVDVTVGKPLRQEDIRSSEDRLADRYDDVTPVVTTNAEGVDVTFRLVPRHPITKLDVTGSTGIAPSVLKDRILQRYGGVPTGSRVADVEATAVTLLNDEGYLSATARSHTILQHAPESATLVLEVEAGTQARILKTDVNAPTLTASEVIARTHSEPGQPYRRRAIETALSAIEDDLRQRGYYEVQATAPATITPAGVNLQIVVDAGPLVRLVVDPPGSLPGNVDDLIPIDRQRSADQDLLEDSKARIEDALENDGYARASAPFSTATTRLANGQDELVVTFRITRGPKFIVDQLAISSGLSLPDATIRDLIAVRPGDVFSKSRFEQGVARVIAEYLRRGYYKAEAVPSYDEVQASPDAPVVRVVAHPNITEGPRGEVSTVTVDFEGTHQLGEQELRQVMRLKAGSPYSEADRRRDVDALRTLYLDRGFQTVAVAITPAMPGDGRAVSLRVVVNEGPQIRIGEITIVGNERVSTHVIQDELRLTEGEPLSARALTEAQRRLDDTGAFRRVSITTADRVGDETSARVIVSVVEAAATTIGFGGGVGGGTHPRAIDTTGGQVDRLEFSPSGFFEIGRRNLGGRNRSLDFYSRVTLHPRDAPLDPVHDGKGFGFSEYRATATYRERRAFQTDTDLLFGATSEQGVQTTFNYGRHSLNAELLHRVSARLNVSGQYALQSTRLFDVRIDPKDVLPIDRLFPQVRLSIFSEGVSWDSRNNPLAPTHGALFSADSSVAARAIGSQVGYVKTLFQASGFHALDTRGRTVLAARAEVGAAHAFPRAGVVDPDGQLSVDLPASERFFAGGSTSVRGFQEDRLGVPEIIDPVTDLSNGGNGVIVLNAEVRRSVSKLFGRDLHAVGFLDAGNVFKKAVDVNLANIRGAVGFGVRYDSPLGPVRLDFGFKLNHQTGDDRSWEYHLSIGEAF